MTERLRLLGDIDSYVGKYFSEQWVRTHVLRMTEEDIKAIEKQISGEMPDEEEPMGDEEPQEEYIPPKEISTEEKALVESMTKFMDSMVSEEVE